MTLLEPSGLWRNNKFITIFEHSQNKSIIYVNLLLLEIINMSCY